MISSLYRRTLVSVGLLFTSRAAAQQPVKVDDGSVYSLGNPNGIQFGSTGWSTVNPTNVDLRYDSTYTWTQTAGSNLVFFFRGTAISHYADKAAHRGPVGVSIDGQPYTTYTWTNVNASTFLYQQQMWTITGLSQGDHQVVISDIGTGVPAESIMGVDYLEVTPGPDGSIIPTKFGPGASVIPSNAVLVDDLSDLISYSGSWDIWTSDYNIGFYFDGGQHSSTSPGAAIIFKFNGTAVWYFCDMFENNTIVSISLDGAPGETINTASQPKIWASRTYRVTQILIWNKTDLADGPHTLTITHAGTEGLFASVDFLVYMPSANALPVSSPSATHRATSTSTSKSSPIGAIVGGVVGGIALIALFACFLVWRWRPRSAGDATTPEYETYAGKAAYGGEAYAHPSAYVQSPSGTPGFGPMTNYQNTGMHPPAQNIGTAYSVTPTAWTGATYTGHPEI